MFHSTFDWLSRVGDVTLGIVAVIFWLIILVSALIELIDFLIVDPIRRARQGDEPKRKRINLPQSGDE